MKKLMPLLIILLFLFAIIWVSKYFESTEEHEDFLAEALAMNSEKKIKPPIDFRAGHVTRIPKNTLKPKKTKDGFELQFPGKTQIPTLTYCEGFILTGGGFHSREFYALDANTGKVKWSVNLDDDGPSTAACEDGVIIFNTESCTIFALELKSGKMLWSLWLGDPLMTSPTIANGMVFTAYPASPSTSSTQGFYNTNPIPQEEGDKKTTDTLVVPVPTHALIALELKTGKIHWQKWIDSDIMSSPVAEDNKLYVATFSGNIYNFQQSDGKILSAKRTRATSAPVLVGEELVYTERSDSTGEEASESIVTRDVHSKQKKSIHKKTAPYLDKSVQSVSKLSSKSKDLDSSNGFSAGAPTSANPQVAYDNIGQNNVSSLQAFQGSRILNYKSSNINVMGDEIIATNVGDGKKIWTNKLSGNLKEEGGSLASPPALAGNSLFMSLLSGKILQVNPENGKIEKEYSVGELMRFQPIIQNGKIYTTTETGKLICIDTKNPTFTGWTTWGANSRRTGKL